MPSDDPTTAAPVASDPAAAPAIAVVDSAASPAAPAAPAAPTAPAPAPAAVAAAPEPAPAIPAAPTPAHEIPTLLETATAKPTEPEKPAAGEPTTAAAPAPFTYEPFVIPDGITADPERIAAYTALLSEHRVPQETAQKLLDLHAATMQQQAAAMAADQQRAFTEMRNDWATQIRGDAELGGSGYQTTVHAVAEMRDLFVAAEHRKEFDDFLRVTGAGDHPAFWRLLNNAAKRFREPAMPNYTPAPVPDRGAPPRGARGSFAAAIYDHPTSVRAAGR